MADANYKNALAMTLAGGKPYNALAQFNEPMQPNALGRGILKPGPDPTGYDRLFDGIYGMLGGTPDRRALAEALAGGVNVGTLGIPTAAYDGAKELAQTGKPSSLAMALMPGAKVAGAGAKAARGLKNGAFSGEMPVGYVARGEPNTIGQVNYDVEWFGPSGAQNVGSAYVRDLGDKAQVGKVKIAPDHARKGIGSALYGQIERDLGKPLIPDFVLTDAAYNFWKKHQPDAVAGYVKQYDNWVKKPIGDAASSMPSGALGGQLDALSDLLGSSQ